MILHCVISDAIGEETIPFKYTGVELIPELCSCEVVFVLGKGHQEMLLLKLQILGENMAILGWMTFVLITLSRIPKYGHMNTDLPHKTYFRTNLNVWNYCELHMIWQMQALGHQYSKTLNVTLSWLWFFQGNHYALSFLQLYQKHEIGKWFLIFIWFSFRVTCSSWFFNLCWCLSGNTTWKLIIT